ncbi:hypothetical protein R1sor_020637 [Riccia sorocarpa]|uniref:EF-hand domain-containing protein n=1 Tax=Riccia sorocarpa TaxID=122646 RepID=A0ABD3GIE3_9MARC
MEGSQGGKYPAPSAPPAPSAYPQTPWQPPQYSTGHPDYGPNLTYSPSQRVQPTYQSQASFSGAPAFTTQNTYAGPPSVPFADTHKMNSYNQDSYGRPSYSTSQTLPSSYGQPPPPTSYGQPAPQSYAHQQSYAPQNTYPPQYPPAYPAPYGQPGYGRTKVQFPQGTDPEAIMAFEQGDTDGSGFIDGSELGRVLSTGVSFSMRTVHLMLHLYAAKSTNKIGPAEFVALWKALKEWKGVFERFDRDRSGRIDTQELKDALLSMGYALSPNLLNILISKYDKTGQAKALDYDNFVECGLVVKGLTDSFKAKDVQFRGSATLDYEMFMQMVLPFIVA